MNNSELSKEKLHIQSKTFEGVNFTGVGWWKKYKAPLFTLIEINRTPYIFEKVTL